MKSSSLYAALILSIALAALHSAAEAHYLYWVYWWYDVMMHFLAGATLGFFVYWFLFVSGHGVKGARSRRAIMFWVVFIVLVLGLAWEVFEYVNAIADSHEGYMKDTVNDLILDSCGAALAALVATRRKRND